ncbi:MAG: hypothetical protein IK999_02910 [Ruminococcus sp.]|nr:hypothetical protein [Ruminococcus sp.]
MSKKVLVISSSLRNNSNSETLARQAAKSGMQGWVDCFDKARLAGVLSGGGLADAGDAKRSEHYMQAAYDLGKDL